MADPAVLAAAIIVALAFALRGVLLRVHAFNPDEFQHLHGAWCIGRGLVPYRDYFEHHTPWLHYLLAPLLLLFDVKREAAEAVAFIFFARRLMWAVSGLALALTLRLGWLVGGARRGWLAAAFLSLTVLFTDLTLEIRPDVPALACLLASWVATLVGLGRSRGPRTGEAQTARRGAPLPAFAAAGFLHGAAVMFTQKALFAGPGTGAVLLLHLLAPAAERPVRQRLHEAAAFCGGGLLPLLATAAFFAAQGSLGAFVDLNLLINAGWKARVAPGPALHLLLQENPTLVALGIAGFVLAAARALATRTLGAEALLVLEAASILGGGFVIPVAYPQYFLMLTPVLALLAASAAADAAEVLARHGPSRVTARASGPALAVLLVGLSVHPFDVMWRIAHPHVPKVEIHLRRLHELMAQVRPGEVVMDGFSGLGVFRPHAWYYFFLHDEVRALLDPQQLHRLLVQLRDGTIAPACLVMDNDLRALPADIQQFFRDNYEPAGEGLLWPRKRLWLDDPSLGGRLDLGDPPTDALAGEGWYPPEREGDLGYRRGRGGTSSVRLPIQAPRDLTLVFRARAEYPGAPVRFEVRANGTAVGEAALSAGWGEHAVRVPATALRAGMNTLRLVYSVVPREVDRGWKGRNSAAAVDWIEVRPTSATRPPP